MSRESPWSCNAEVHIDTEDHWCYNCKIISMSSEMLLAFKMR